MIDHSATISRGHALLKKAFESGASNTDHELALDLLKLAAGDLSSSQAHDLRHRVDAAFNRQGILRLQELLDRAREENIKLTVGAIFEIVTDAPDSFLPEEMDELRRWRSVSAAWDAKHEVQAKWIGHLVQLLNAADIATEPEDSDHEHGPCMASIERALAELQHRRDAMDESNDAEALSTQIYEGKTVSWWHSAAVADADTLNDIRSVLSPDTGESLDKAVRRLRERAVMAEDTIKKLRSPLSVADLNAIIGRFGFGPAIPSPTGQAPGFIRLPVETLYAMLNQARTLTR